MSTLLLDSAIELPTGVDQFDAFRDWVASSGFPERGRIDFVRDHVEVDARPEDPAFHGRPKVEVARVIANRVKQLDWGDVDVDATRIVCRRSVTKDSTRLWSAYFDAGIAEYWIVDVRPGRSKFEIWERGAGEYVPTPTTEDGFRQSPLLSAGYRLDCREGRGGRMMYDLVERPLS
ncbi:MAG: hypothetical protein ACK5Q5_22145 [Planctomycetaceae bacterium]